MKIKKNQNCPENHPLMTSKMKKWPQKWKFQKKIFFLKSSNNLEKNKKIKNLPKNSPQNDLKNEKFTSKMKILDKIIFF